MSVFPKNSDKLKETGAHQPETNRRKEAARRPKNRYARLSDAFDADHILFWSTLSRQNNLVVIMNISMFFLTGLVARGYYYTFFSLGCAGAVAVGILIPTTCTRRLGYFWVFLVMEFLGIYFLVASVIYWVHNGAGPA